MNLPINQFPSIEQMTGQLNTGRNTNRASKPIPGSPFSDILKEKQDMVKATAESMADNRVEAEELKFSKHANERLASRKIDLTDEQFRRLENGARKAGEKGILESLVLVDNLAFIVNIRNNTVITAVNDGEERIFTNIDGAVIV